MFEVSEPLEVFYKKGARKTFQNLPENTCARVSFAALSAIFIKKETLAQVFSCEFCEIFKNRFFAEHLQVTASHFQT